ncbi:DUF4012 domain-containing protein [Microbacterium sp. cx-55]|uniref:DUF4012 domain-containing protein n=1 Tax=Microbacterium sp. cx-55 TaxID=2875948 RepID=UPI001CBCC46E|nr:DUF4012 domain-containing protein [Microbacterium sp. cx-55]MBZ4487653.1 DUF4012 domain-containing protein [Microbacterium sp. cx-55]UGB35665.1 DUF4012 domain-containing protein [Microbacterium sp. cx-55]
MTNPLLPRPARTAGRVFVWVLLAVAVLTVAAAAWLGVRGYLAYSHLRSAESAARQLSADVGDPATAAAGLPAISSDTAAARALTSDPIWTAAESLPWVGPQLSTVGTLAASIDDVAGSALEPLVDLASTFSVDSLRPTDGRFDLTKFDSMQTAAASSAAQVGVAANTLQNIDRGPLLPVLATSVDEVGELLGTVQTAADAVSRTTALMPAMLGEDGPRNYLVVFQNNAEWRSLGGIVGAMAMIHTEDGSLTLAAQGSSSDFTKYDTPVLDIGPELTGIMGAKPAQFIQNATQVPSFPLAAELAREMWARETGTQVDGVLSLDPVALSYLLKATGPITLPTGDVLSSENATQLLLNEVYQRYERPADQDAFFQAAAASVFGALAAGSADPATLISALAQAGEEQRLLIWNANETEQAILDGTTLQGDLPETDAEQTAFGVYVNDGTGSKMDYYMTLGTGVAWCTDTESTPDAALTVTLRDDAPADAASLPAYITGNGGFGVEAGLTETITYLYLPEGSEVVATSSSGGGSETGFGTGTDSGRTVLTWSTTLRPGEEATATVRVRTPPTASLVAETTPVLPGKAQEVEARCSAAG